MVYTLVQELPTEVMLPIFCLDANRQGMGWGGQNSAFVAGAKYKYGDRVLGEGEQDSFIALPGKGSHSKLMP